MKDIDVLIRVARGVREHIMDIFPRGGGGNVVGCEYDGSDTFEIDREAESAAMKVIVDLDPEVNVLSEGAGLVRGNSDRTIIMDPIDGSHNAVSGIPFYSISLAMSRGGIGDVRHAVVCDIVRGVTYHASKGAGAFRDQDRVHTRKMDEGEATFSSFLSRKNLGQNVGLLSLSKKARYLGSVSLELCLVAQGSLDMFAMLSRPPRVVDLAAGCLILKEAGGNTYWYENYGKWGEYTITEDVNDMDGILSLGDPSHAARLFERFPWSTQAEVGEG